MLSISVSLIAVFIPILLMGGIVGRLFREFAVTLSVAIAVSLVVSLTTTPMMCARFLKPERGQQHGKLYRASERVFDGCCASTSDRSLVSCGIQPLILLVDADHHRTSPSTSTSIVPKGFFPQQDTGRLMGAIQGAQDISFPAMRDKLGEFDRPSCSRIRPSTTWSASRWRRHANTGRVFVQLKPLKERKITADAVITRLRAQTPQMPGATLFLQAAQDIRVGGRGSNAQYQYTLRRDNLAGSEHLGAALLRKLRTVPEITRRQHRPAESRPGTRRSIIDRDTASRLGISPQADRRRALRRVRTAAGLDDVHGAEPVPRRHGSRAAVSGTTPTA